MNLMLIKRYLAKVTVEVTLSSNEGVWRKPKDRTRPREQMTLKKACNKAVNEMHEPHVL